MPEAAPLPPASKPKSAPQKAMEKLGLVRDIDLALHLPMRYEDETRITPIGALQDNEPAQVEGVVVDCQIELRGRRQLLVRVRDVSGTPGQPLGRPEAAGAPSGGRASEDARGGTLLLRFLHFYPSQQKQMAVGARLRLRGEPRIGFFGREMVHPVVKVVDDDTPLAKELTPVYPASAQLPQAYLRKAVASGLARADLREILPPGVVPRGLPTLKDALTYLHHPPPSASLEALLEHHHPAWHRLKFEELLAQQLSQLQAQRERALLVAPALKARRGGLHEQLLGVLPFQLTAAQQRVCEEIAHDLARPQPTHRLLQGDVGSGKTVVAALAAAIAIDAGWQCALMAPTEILAEQHFRKLIGWLEPLGLKVAWITGSVKGKARQKMLDAAASGEAQLIVGTHAVIEDKVKFAKLGLAIIDEQHRFGVAQRLALRNKLKAGADAGPPQGGARPLGGQEPQATWGPTDSLEPHLLMMSATPIPRTLAMTYFADLDVSTIDELPPGRSPIVTKVFTESKRHDVIDKIRMAVADGAQVYWVCPLVEESEAVDLRNATETHAELSETLAGTSVGLLHGRMSPADKAAVMAQFSSGAMSVLVATTVIEVGVDVPNASLMVIEHAERFGLAQLHQLRGRVGRGSKASVCVLIYTPPLSDTGKSRLKAMAETTDGFEIARRDLDIRGPGEFMGSRQSGAELLRFADLQEDAPLLVAARELAPWLLDEHPDAARRQVQRWLGTKAEFLKA